MLNNIINFAPCSQKYAKGYRIPFIKFCTHVPRKTQKGIEYPLSRKILIRGRTTRRHLLHTEPEGFHTSTAEKSMLIVGKIIINPTQPNTCITSMEGQTSGDANVTSSSVCLGVSIISAILLSWIRPEILKPAGRHLYNESKGSGRPLHSHLTISPTT